MSTTFICAGTIRWVGMYCARQPVVGHVDRALHRSGRAEHVVGPLDLLLGDGAEDGGLADVGESDDAAGESHG
jgi:hypothetical protein